MPDYSKTIIYKLVCNDVNVTNCYVGHTTNFISRKNGHKTTCNNPNSPDYNIKVYKSIRDNGGWDNWKMVMIEPYPCENVLEAEKKEREWFEKLEADLNSKFPTRTLKEYNEMNKEKLAEQRKEYYETHKEQFAEKSKKYREEHREQCIERGKKYYETHKEQHSENTKKYYEEHKDEIKDYLKKYYEENKEHIFENVKKNYIKNKERILDKMKQKVSCPHCEKLVSQGNMKRHIKEIHEKILLQSPERQSQRQRKIF